MPNRDGTGPNGEGSKTGRGTGYCTKKDYEERPRYYARRGRGLGMGRGRGRRYQNYEPRESEAGVGRGRGGLGRGPCAYDLESELDDLPEMSDIEKRLKKLEKENEELRERLKSKEE